MANLSSSVFAGSIGVRLIDIMLAAELDTLITLFWFASEEYALSWIDQDIVKIILHRGCILISAL